MSRAFSFAVSFIPFSPIAEMVSKTILNRTIIRLEIGPAWMYRGTCTELGISRREARMTLRSYATFKGQWHSLG